MRGQSAGILAIVGSTVLSALFFGIILGGPAIAWAAPTVAVTTLFTSSAGGNNSCCIEVGVPTDVTIRAQILDWQSAKAGSLSVKLIRLNDSGTETTVCQMKDSASIGTGQGSSGHNQLTGIFVCTNTFREPLSAFIRLQVLASYNLLNKQSGKSQSQIFILYVGTTVDPAAETTIPGDGFTITVHPHTFLDPVTSLDTPAFVAGQLGDPSSIVGQGDKAVEAVLQLKVEDPVSGIDLTDATKGFDLAVATTLANTTKLLVAQQVDTGGPTLGLVPVAAAVVTNGEITTAGVAQPAGFEVHESGTFAFLLDLHSGYVTGTVTETVGGVAKAREGVIVSNDTNTLTAVTDANGVYTLFLDDKTSGQYLLTAKDPFRCTVGPRTGPIPSGGATTSSQNIGLVLSPSEASRPGLRNAGFEHGDLACWTVTGNVTIAPQLGPTGNYSPSGALCKSISRSGTTYQNVCSPSTAAGGVTILPSEGAKMAVLSTASGPSTMKQTFTVPNGVSTLRMDYNYVSEELPEWAGSIRPFDDPFKIYIAKEGEGTLETPCTQPVTTTPCLVTQVTVDTAAALPTTSFIGDCGFTGGDTTCSRTGWQTATVDLSNFDGTSTKFVLTFTVANSVDTTYETRVFVDNIRFKTVWLDVKVLDNVSSSSTRIPRDVLRTSDILSQAGVNVRLRGTTTEPGVDSAIDVTHQLSSTSPSCIDANNNILVGLDGVALQNKILTTEESQLMSLARSTITTDINVYYVNSATGVSGVSGWTANRGDFCSQVNLPAPLLGSMITNLASSKTMAHELAHALIKAVSGGTLLHGATAGTVANATTLSPTIQPAQSAAIQQSPNLAD